MSFFVYFQVIGTIALVVACVMMVNNPIEIDQAPAVNQVASYSPITESHLESQAAQLVASPSTKRNCKVEELVDLLEAATLESSEEDCEVEELADLLEATTLTSSSVAGAQQIETTTSIVVESMDIEMTDVASVYAEISEVISVEVEMVDAPVPPLKSCLKSKSAFRSAKSVRFEGPSSDSIRGQIALFEVKSAPSYHKEYMMMSQAPHKSFPLFVEFDDEGNLNGWFTKRDGKNRRPTFKGTFDKCRPWAFCNTCKGNLADGFLDPITNFPKAVLEADSGSSLHNFVEEDQIRRYHCESHGGY